MTATRIVIIAKAPIAGFAKTRLIPALGAKAAADLAKRFLLHTVANALASKLAKVELCVTPNPLDSAGRSLWQNFELPDGIEWSDQGDGDLGARMARAALRCLKSSMSILLIGTDCPALTVDALQAAQQALLDHDAVLVPTHDGGYALLGLNQFDASLFEDMPWSTSSVAALTLARIKELAWTVKVLATQHDIDEPTDLQWLPRRWSGGRQNDHVT